MSLLLRGAPIYSAAGMQSSATLLLDQGVIAALGETGAAALGAQVLDFPATYHIVPGFIDLHVHGANGHDVMDGTVNALHAISAALAAEGTTGFLATTMTAPTSAIEQALTALRDFMRLPNSSGAAVLGAHLEGPFIAAAKMGAQHGDHIIAPDVALLRHWRKLSGDQIRLVTLAPELPDSHALIAELRAHHIIAAIGHTDATYDETVRAITAGCTHATHLFNAMRGIQHREPGTVTAALLADEVMVELIVDGVHLHPAIVQLVLKTKGLANVVLVTDAMRAKCLADGCYDLGGQTVTVRHNAARLADGTLAGSVLRMSSALQNMLAFTGCELAQALPLITANPARALGIQARKGNLAVGMDADVVVLNEKLQVVMTICGGNIVFQTNNAYAE